MAYFVFGDESGGLANRQDRYVVIAAVGAGRVRQFEQLVKQVRSWLQQRGKKYRNVGELRFHTAEDETRLKLIRRLARTDIDIYLLVVEKDSPLIEDTPENYALMLLPLVQEILERFPEATFAFDKHFSKLLHQEQVRNVLETRTNRKLYFEQADSQNNSGIQIADFVAGAALARYQREEEKYLEILRDRIVVERWLTELK